MKIVLVMNLFPFGGAGVIAKEYAYGLGDEHEVTFLHAGPEARRSVDRNHEVVVLPEGDRSSRLKNYLNPHLAGSLSRELERIRPDVVHVHLVQHSTFSLASLLQGRRWPMVWTLHDLWSQCLASYPIPLDCENMLSGCLVCRTWPGLSILNKILKETVYALTPMSVTVPSHWLARLVGRSVLSRRDLEVIPYGIDLPAFAEEDRRKTRAALGLPIEGVLAFFAGGTYPERKGLEDVLQAMDRVDPALRPRLVLAGKRFDPEPRDYVTSVGEVDRDRMKQQLWAADMVLVPSRADNLPVIVLEAMAARRAVIAYRVGGIPESVIHGETGLLVEPGDVAALGAAIETLARDAVSRERLGDAALARALVEYPRPRMIERTLEVYRRARARVLP